MTFVKNSQLIFVLLPILSYMLISSSVMPISAQLPRQLPTPPPISSNPNHPPESFSQNVSTIKNTPVVIPLNATDVDENSNLIEQ